MQSDLNGQREDELEAYFLAGLATATHFMERFRLAFLDLLAQSGIRDRLGRPVHSELLFPYGDWNRRALAQLWEIRSDMRLPPAKISISIGGKRALAAMAAGKPVTGRGRTTLFVGHSGGGIAAIHAAHLLMKSGSRSKCLAIMIGSPKCRIPQELRQSALSISAAGIRSAEKVAEGKSPDLVSRLGTHGGWVRSMERGQGNHSGFGMKLPSWHKHKHAPGTLITVPIVGGHADYFRESAPYVNSEGVSNLALTLEAIRSWLIQWT
jgi:hypothetical protein